MKGYYAIRTLCVLVLLSVLTTGCGTMQAYPGEKLPTGSVALVQRQTIKMRVPFSLTLEVAEIDGLKPTIQRDIEVLPGEHTLCPRLTMQTHLALAPLALLRGLKATPARLTFRAEAGRRYMLNGQEGQERLYYIWVEDLETGSVVGGKRPD